MGAAADGMKCNSQKGRLTKKLHATNEQRSIILTVLYILKRI